MERSLETLTDTYIYTDLCIYIHTYIHTHECICIHTYIHTYMHTYRRRVERSLETLTDTTPVVLPEELRAIGTRHTGE